MYIIYVLSQSTLKNLLKTLIVLVSILNVVPRKNPNFGNRVKLNEVTTNTKLSPTVSNHIGKGNTVTLKNPELIQDLEQRKQQRQLDMKTIQISIESYKALETMTEYFNHPSYSEVIITIVDHFRKNVVHRYGEYLDEDTDQ